MVDTVTLGLNISLYQIDTDLWSEDQIRRIMSLKKRVGNCIFCLRHIKNAVRISITASLGTLLNGHNRDFLTRDEVHHGLELIRRLFLKYFNVEVSLNELQITRVDFYGHILADDPTTTLLRLGNQFLATKRDWVKILASDAPTVINKIGSVTVCYYTKYDPKIEGHLTQSIQAFSLCGPTDVGVIRAEVRLSRRSFRRQELRSLDKAVDILPFIDEGLYEKLISPHVELVQIRAKEVAPPKLLATLKEINGDIQGYRLWSVSRDLEEYGVEGVRSLSGAKARTVREWQSHIDQASCVIDVASEFI